MSEMRILTVRQPWAWAIIHGGKDVENRVRNIAGSYRGPVAIHAALAYDDEASWNPTWPALSDALDEASADVWDAPEGRRGVIIGVVDLTDVHDPTEPLFGLTGCQGQCTAWAEEGLWHLVLANPRPLSEPIPFKGALGLRRLDDATTEAVLGAIA